jgi:hypothetical protein
MGADFCLWTVSWPKSAELNWDAGMAVVDGMDEDKLDGSGLDKDGLKGCVEELKSAVVGFHREAAILEFAHLNVLITGGMSWGDTPTELSTAMQAMEDFSSVLAAIGFDQDNEDYKSLLKKVLALPGLAPQCMGVDERLDELVADALRTPAKKSRKKRSK